jgi:hypothetical protein
MLQWRTRYYYETISIYSLLAFGTVSISVIEPVGHIQSEFGLQFL